MNVEIVWDGGSDIDTDVQRFWRDGTDLIVRYEEGRERRYEHGEAVAVATADESLDDPQARVA
jgi:hypothetical protein